MSRLIQLLYFSGIWNCSNDFLLPYHKCPFTEGLRKKDNLFFSDSFSYRRFKSPILYRRSEVSVALKVNRTDFPNSGGTQNFLSRRECISDIIISPTDTNALTYKSVPMKEVFPWNNCTDERSVFVE